MIATQCPNPNTLHALSTGRLEESQSEPLLEHLRDCQRCRAELETLQDAEDSIVALLRQPNEGGEYDSEPDCKRALAKALGALAIAGETASESDWQQLPETIGEYEILRPLGRGGMGRVFLARHSKLGRQVALKLALIDRLGDPRVRRRFETEMRAVGKLSHPNIVTAHDAREIDGTAVLVTEYIDGLDLAQLVRRAGPLAIPDACAIICQVADALQYIADEGFVHRDVKPSNIMLSRDGQVKLLDLGLARFHGNDDASEMTGTGQAMGTADYVAPEQVADGRSVDVRADIYALGGTLFYLLTGSPPFASQDYPTAFAKMNAHVSTAAPSLASRRSDCPAEVTRLVDAMLSKQPDRRPAQPAEVATRLEKRAAGADLQALAARAADLALAPQVEVAPPIVTAARRQPLPWMRRKIPVPLAIAAGLLGFFGGLALGIIITITRPDGSQVVIAAPEGSDVDIRSAEAAPVQPPVAGKASDPSGAAPAPQPADRFQKYAGYWRVREASNREAQPGSGIDHVVVENARLHLLKDGKLVASGRLEEAARASEEFVPPTNFTFVDEIGGVSVAGDIANNDPFAPDADPFTSTADPFTSAAGPFTGVTLRLVDFKNLADVPADRLIDYPLVLPATLKLSPLTGSAAARIEAVLREQRVTVERSDDNTLKRLQGVWLFMPATAELSAPPLPAVLAFQGDRFFIARASGLFQGRVRSVELSQSGELQHLVLAFDGISVRFGDPSSDPERHESLDRDISVRFLPDSRLQMFAHQFPVPGEPISSDAVDPKSGQLRMLKRIGDLPRDAAELATLQAGQPPEVAQAVELIWGLLQATGDDPEADAAALKIRAAADRAQTQHNLKQIGMAMQNFHDSYRKLPGSSNVREGGLRPSSGEIHPFSWRVAILPFVENVELFEAYRFDQPWDGPDNLKLLERMPEVYRSPFASAEFVEVPQGHTLYQGLVGPQTALGPGHGEVFWTFTDGTSNTLLIVESLAAVPWTKPEDLTYQSAEDARRIQPLLGQPLSFVTADAAPHFMDPIDYDRLAKLITRNGGEPVEP